MESYVVEVWWKQIIENRYLLVLELGVKAISCAKNWPYCITKWV